MEKQKKYKHILDSVHGNIYIEKDLVTNIVDTPAFQRLRRIEQTSTRAIFPSARHDRFIHSLGVYHIGCLMTKQLKNVVAESDELKTYVNLVDNLSDCFEIACLLHDIGHSPFSHTFEKYFGEDKESDKDDGKQKLREQLLSELQNVKTDKILRVNLQELNSKKKDTNYHELVSAIIAVKEFSTRIPQYDKTNYDNVEFVARMIIGCKYYYKKEEVELQLRNCFIDLLHGGIIDADRLDYACRDVWASGYRTSSVDISRLIAGLYIEKNVDNKGEYVVCFKSNVLNEIQSVLDVKDFQVQYVLNHHAVILEQHFLEQAALKMAEELTSKSIPTITPLRKILRWNALTEEGIKINTLQYKGHQISIRYMCDDDLIFLLKLSDNEYYQKWNKRQFGYKALWKTRDDFFYSFEIPRTSIGDKLKEIIETTLTSAFPALKEKENLLIKKVTYKSRIELDKLHIYMYPGHVTDYGKLYRETDIIPPSKKDDDKDVIFYYVFIKNHALGDITIQNIIEKLKEPIMQEYKQRVSLLKNKEMYKYDILKALEKYLN